MLKVSSLAICLMLALAGCAGAACSTDETPAEACSKCPVPTAGRNLPTGVSFAEDLLADPDPAANAPAGVLRRACAFAVCHGRRPGKARLYLGPSVHFSACSGDASAGPCTRPGDDTWNENDCRVDVGPAAYAPCVQPPTFCKCGDQDCAPGVPCAADGGCAPDGGPVVECSVDSPSCGGGGYCVRPETVCECSLGVCEVGQRCVNSSIADFPELRTSIIDDLTSRASRTYPKMKLVEPGDPEKSFLMLKVDGCHGCISGVRNCAEDDSTSVDCCHVQPGAIEFNGEVRTCGDGMPRGVDPLPAADRDVIRAWILEGAQDN